METAIGDGWSKERVFGFASFWRANWNPSILKNVLRATHPSIVGKRDALTRLEALLPVQRVARWWGSKSSRLTVTQLADTLLYTEKCTPEHPLVHKHLRVLAVKCESVS